MTHVPLYPHENDASHSQEPRIEPEEEKIEYISPPFVIIDDRQQTEESLESSSEAAAETPKSPFSMRFLCFLGLIFCLIFGTGMFLMSLVSTLIATISLFRNKELNQTVKQFWKLSTHTLIAGLGFVLGIISPTLGLGLIVLYFSVTGEVVDNSLLHSIIKRSFNNF